MDDDLKRVSDWRPIFIENSKVPVILSYVSPIDIWAINLVFFVFCRGEISKETKVHETIHYQQWLELFIIGFLILYPAFWIRNLFKGMNPAEAYRYTPFEVEAYDNQAVDNYLKNRRRYEWARSNQE